MYFLVLLCIIKEEKKDLPVFHGARSGISSRRLDIESDIQLQGDASKNISSCVSDIDRRNLGVGCDSSSGESTVGDTSISIGGG